MRIFTKESFVRDVMIVTLLFWGCVLYFYPKPTNTIDTTINLSTYVDGDFRYRMYYNGEQVGSLNIQGEVPVRITGHCTVEFIY